MNDGRLRRKDRQAVADGSGQGAVSRDGKARRWRMSGNYDTKRRLSNRKVIQILFLFMTLVATHVFAGEGIQPFTAVCKDIETHAYRYSTDMDGKVYTNEFESGEKFGGDWKFNYTGGDHIIIDGNKAATIIGTAASGTIILAIEGSGNVLSVGAWSYAIHLKLKRIVASQVHASSLIGDSVKARSVKLECDFS